MNKLLLILVSFLIFTLNSSYTPKEEISNYDIKLMQIEVMLDNAQKDFNETKDIINDPKYKRKIKRFK